MADLKRLAMDLRKCSREIVRVTNQANAKVAKGAVQTGKYFASGAFSSKTLARMDHPYATRHGGASVPYGDPGVINKQSGVFRSSWTFTQVSQSNGLILFTVCNTDPIADYLEHGTRKMIARPIDNFIKEYVQRTQPILLAQSIEQAIRKSLPG